ncbi:MAG: hypothetical protein ACOZJX_19130 [Pseudomonadota bacterium]
MKVPLNLIRWVSNAAVAAGVTAPIGIAAQELSWQDYLLLQRTKVERAYREVEAALSEKSLNSKWYKSLTIKVEAPGRGACSISGNPGAADLERFEITICPVPNIIISQAATTGLLVQFDMLSKRRKSLAENPNLYDSKLAQEFGEKAALTLDYYFHEARHQHRSYQNADIGYRNCPPATVAKMLVGDGPYQLCGSDESTERDIQWANSLLRSFAGPEINISYDQVLGRAEHEIYLWSVSHEVAHFVVHYDHGRSSAPENDTSLIDLEVEVDKVGNSLLERDGELRFPLLHPGILWTRNTISGGIDDSELGKHGAARLGAAVLNSICDPRAAQLFAYAPHLMKLMPLEKIRRNCTSR